MAVPDETTPLIADAQEGGNVAQPSAAAAAPTVASDFKPTGTVLNLILASLFMVIFLSALDATIVATIYAKIGSEFNKSNEVSWVATSYMLSSTAFQPMYGRLSDIFGRRTALLVGLLIFLAGSTLCAMAYDLNTLVLARAIAGIGGGGTLTASSIIMSDLVSLRERGRLQGFGNAVFGSASLVGAPLGGLIADTLGWRFSFWMNLPLGIVPVIMIMCFVPDYNVIKGVGVWEKVKQIDFLGIFSLSGSMVLLVLALSLGGNELPWDNFYVILYIVSGLLLLGFFIYVEGYVASHPIMPLHLLKERTPLSSFLICFFSSMSSLSSVFLIPVWFQVVLGQSTSQSGLHLIPKIVGSSFGSISAGIYMSRTGEYRKFTWLALGAMVVAETLILYRWNIHTGEEEYLPYLIIDGFGFGSVLTTTLVAMLAAIPPQDMAVSSAMTYLFRSTGSVLGVASSQAALQAVLNTALHKRFTGPDAERIIEIARKSAAELRARLSPDVVAIVVEAYVEAIQAGFVVCVVCAGLAVGASLILGRHALRS